MSASANQFGKLFQWTTFGESHGPAVGVVIDGCPAGVDFDLSLLTENLKKRRPGQPGTSGRDEKDQPEVLSGVFEGKTLGTPISIVVRNTNQESKDYDNLKDNPRIGHADDVWQEKFGLRDHRGGGRASARETLNWVIAGSVAQMFLRSQYPKMSVQASLLQVGGESFSSVDDSALQEKLKKAKEAGESFGAFIGVEVNHPPKSVGEPVFRKLKAEMTHAFMTVNATCSVEIGEGVQLATMKGTEVHTDSGNSVYGGQRGGISSGETLRFRVGFKPTSSILDVAKHGRHDPCVALRAVPILEAMAYSVIADLELAKRLNRI